MNAIGAVRVTRGEVAYVEIEIDGKRLAHHFAGRLGAHHSSRPPKAALLSSAEFRKLD